MNLSFSREADSEIKVLMEIEGHESDFDYIKFIDHLYSTKSEITVSYSDDISDDEKTKLNEMIKEIKDQVIQDQAEDTED